MLHFKAIYKSVVTKRTATKGRKHSLVVSAKTEERAFAKLPEAVEVAHTTYAFSHLVLIKL